MKSRRMCRKDYMQKLLNDFMAKHGGGTVDADALYRWAKETGQWYPPPRSEKSRFKEELRRAASDEKYTDPQGRKVRRKHVVVLVEEGIQRSLWADISEAPPEHMRVSLQQRKRCIGGDVRQLLTDKESYNDNNQYGASIQMSLNFDEDWTEQQHPAEYPDGPPDEDVDDEMKSKPEDNPQG